MECCQGRPYQPCPESRQDETVRYSIYDLFLCRACEEYRDNEQQSASGSKPSAPDAKVKRQSARNANSKKASDKPASTSMTEGGGSNQRGGGGGDLDFDDTDGDEANCSHCRLPITDKRKIKCDICCGEFHQKCTAMPPKVFDKFIVNVGTTGWVCDDCRESTRKSHRRLELAIANLAQELAIVKSELFILKNCCEKTTTSSGDANTNAAADNEADVKTSFIVHRTLNDNAKRKQNIIVSGLPETGNTNDDRMAFLKLCEENLTVKPLVPDNACIRIGKSQPRRLLVRLRSEDTATAVLRDAPSLRLSQSPQVASKVYINPDLSPAAAQLAFEARKLRRDKRNQLKQATRSSDDNQTVTAPVAAIKAINAASGTVEVADAAASRTGPEISHCATNALNANATAWSPAHADNTTSAKQNSDKIMHIANNSASSSMLGSGPATTMSFLG